MVVGNWLFAVCLLLVVCLLLGVCCVSSLGISGVVWTLVIVVCCVLCVV